MGPRARKHGCAHLEVLRSTTPSREALRVAGCLCKLVQYIFISGRVHAPPFRMHIQIAHPPLSTLRFSLLHLLRLLRVEDAGYRRRVYFIKMRSATVNPRTVWDIYRFDVNAISIELRRRGTDHSRHLHDLSAHGFSISTTGIAWSWTATGRSVKLCVLIPCAPRRVLQLTRANFKFQISNSIA
jgi:hypothetical protein